MVSSFTVVVPIVVSMSSVCVWVAVVSPISAVVLVELTVEPVVVRIVVVSSCTLPVGKYKVGIRYERTMNYSKYCLQRHFYQYCIILNNWYFTAEDFFRSDLKIDILFNK